ncbi:MAG: ATP-binding protein, partial [Bacteroidales bacterium]|nr:ATP-binding protein [Bacteroidales bacterium]
MKYNIDKSSLSEERILWLDNLESGLRLFLQKKVDAFPTLSIILACEVKEFGDKFVEIEDNASFDLEGSFAILSAVQSFLEQKISVESSDYTILIKLTFKKKENTAKEEEKSANDGLPTFIPVNPRYDFDQIIMDEEIKKKIFDALNVIENKELIYKVWGFEKVDSKPRSVLNFFGPPGTGKTMCAHAIAKHLSKPLLALNYSEIESKYVGDAPKNLKKAFETAKELDAVMFFDEADSFLGKRIENVSQGAEQALNSLRSQMLILLEDFEGVVLFATNLVTNFDKAFNSRILANIKLDLPNKEARAEIIKVSLPPFLPIEKPFTDEEILEISEIIDGFSGREIKNAILSMLLKKAGEYGKDAIFVIDDLKVAMSAKKEEMERL